MTGQLVAGESSTDASLLRVSTVDTAVRWLTLGALLPVTGAAHRAIAFLISGTVPPLLAVNLPVPQLALVGAGLLIPGLIVGFALALYFRNPSRLPQIRRLSIETGRAGRWWRARRQGYVFRLVVAVSLVATATAILVLFAFPGLMSLLLQSRGLGNLLSNLVAAATFYWGTALGRGVDEVPFRRLVPIVITLMLTIAIASSLGPTTAGTYVAEVRFAASATLPDGTYSVLGEDLGRTWVVACTGGSGPTGVRSDSILSITVLRFGAPPDVPTVAQSLASNRWVAGYYPRCP